MDYLHEFIQQVTKMQWSDYLDIAIVAYLLYRLLPLIRSTGTARVAKAVVVILILSTVTKALDLYALSFLTEQFLQIGLIAIVVLFQPELRRMLDHLGSVKLSTLFGHNKPVQEMEYVITQTVNACRTMSENHTGALIVFARNQDLDEYIKHGVPVDGQVTEQLLRTIFFLNTDLHDKAVIIQKGRLAAARCKLPEAIAPLPTILSELGTRHNSAVGMSQATDAVVVVVSEQTGTISVAVDGMLKRHLAPQMLERLLRSELSVDAPEESNKLSVRLRQKLQKKDKEDK